MTSALPATTTVARPKTNRAIFDRDIASSWRTINFLGAFLAEKFQNLERYLPENPQKKAANDAKKAALKEKIITISKKR